MLREKLLGFFEEQRGLVPLPPLHLRAACTWGPATTGCLCVNEMIQGLSHITLMVTDLDRAKAFFEGVLGAREVYASGEQTFSIAREKFFLLGDTWFAVMEGEAPPRSYQHIALQIDEADYEAWLAKINQAGLEIRPGRDRCPGKAAPSIFMTMTNHLL